MKVVCHFGKIKTALEVNFCFRSELRQNQEAKVRVWNADCLREVVKVEKVLKVLAKRNALIELLTKYPQKFACFKFPLQSPPKLAPLLIRCVFMSKINE